MTAELASLSPLEGRRHIRRRERASLSGLAHLSGWEPGTGPGS